MPKSPHDITSIPGSRWSSTRRELPRQPGAMRALRRTVPAPADLGLELIGVPRAPTSSSTCG